MDTISKRYSACGGRIGAFVTKNKELLDAAMKFAQARLSPPSFAQILGEAAVDLPDDYFNGTRAEYKLRRDTIVKRLNAMDGVFAPTPAVHFIVWPGCPLIIPINFVSGSLNPFHIMTQPLCWHPQPVLQHARTGFERSASGLCNKCGCYKCGNGLFGKGAGSLSGANLICYNERRKKQERLLQMR